MKKSVLGLIIAIVFGAASFANEKMEIENSTIFTEEKEVVDNWMTDLSSWKSSNLSAFEVDMEEDIEIEVWMINLDSGTWNSDREEEIAIENWMTEIADNVWDIVENEDDLTLEDWMLNPTTWLN